MVACTLQIKKLGRVGGGKEDKKRKRETSQIFELFKSYKWHKGTSNNSLYGP